MASTLKHLRSSTADKRPTASGLVDGQLAINTASGTPALFFKDNNGGVVKVGPAHVGSTAPNAVPAGSAGNSLGELWVDNSLTTPGLNYYTGSAFVNLTPSGTTTTIGLVELATPAETQTGTDAVRAVTPSGLQSKVSDSTSTTSSTTIASSTAVKSAYDLANAALPKAGGTVTGELLIGNTGSLVFEGSSDDSFETTIAVVDPTGDRTITFPNVTGTVVTTGDSGTVTSTMIANDTIVNADINSAAAIAYSKLALSSGIVNTDISASAAIVDTKLATISTADKVNISALDIDGATDIGGALEGGDLFVVDDGAGGTNRKAPAFRMSQLVYSGVTGDITIASGGTSAIAAGVIVNDDVNASAAIAGTKISPDFGSQNTTTTGTSTAASFIPTSSTVPTNGVYLPAANSVAISSNGVERVEWGTSEVVFNDGGTNYDFRVEGDTNANLLFVDASTDAVGIGTSAPAALLHLSGLNSGGGAANVIRVTDEDTAVVADQICGRIEFETADTSNPGVNAQLDVLYAGSGGGGEFQFRTGVAGALVNAVRIDDAGFVGIGTTSPSANLHVAAPNNSQLFLQATDTSPTTIILETDAGTSERIRINNKDGALTFDRSNTSESARIDSSGRLGIGTTGPVAPLNVHTASSNTTFAITRGTVGAEYGYLLAGSDGSTTPALRFFPVSNGVQGSEVARITSAGLVGIGTTSPSGLLHVKAATNKSLIVQDGGADTIELANYDASDGYRNFRVSGSSLRFHTGTAGGGSAPERARIDDNGRLLIGTSTARAVFGNTTATAALQIEGSTADTANVSITRATGNAGTPLLTFAKSRGSVGGTPTVVASGDGVGFIAFEGADGTEFVRAASISADVDGTPGANDMPGRLVFSTTPDNQSPVTGPVERMRIRNDGQVLIGATSDAKSGKLEVTGRLAVLNDRESIQTGSATYTASTTATAIIQFDSAVGGFFGAELFVTLCDTASPSGTIVQKVYVAARGSGANVTAVSVSQSDILRQTGETATFTGYLTWTAAVVSNRARLSVTATQTSGAATLTVHCNGAPFSFLI